MKAKVYIIDLYFLKNLEDESQTQFQRENNKI